MYGEIKRSSPTSRQAVFTKYVQTSYQTAIAKHNLLMQCLFNNLSIIATWPCETNMGDMLLSLALKGNISVLVSLNIT